jgi:hypothetical protein
MSEEDNNSMSRIRIGYTSSGSMDYVPLAALGYAMRRAGVLEALAKVDLGIKSESYTAVEKLTEGLVLVLAGGRATSQADLLLRPNRALAQAWGQEQFAQQATLARTLDAFAEESLSQLNGAFDELVRDWSWACRHDFRTGELILDGDLTGLPASRRAEGSEPGYFAGEKSEWAAK